MLVSRTKDLFQTCTTNMATSALTPYAHIFTQYIAKKVHVVVQIVPGVSHRSSPAQFSFLFFGRPCSLLVFISPSASHLLALINCTTFKICFAAMTGDETAASIHGKVESILLARANSIAHALPGAAKRVEAG